MDAKTELPLPGVGTEANKCVLVRRMIAAVDIYDIWKICRSPSHGMHE